MRAALQPRDPTADDKGGDKDESVRSDPQERQRKAIVLRNEIEVLRQKVSEAKSSFQGISKESVPVSTRSGLPALHPHRTGVPAVPGWQSAL